VGETFYRQEQFLSIFNQPTGKHRLSYQEKYHGKGNTKGNTKGCSQQKTTDTKEKNTSPVGGYKSFDRNSGRRRVGIIRHDDNSRNNQRGFDGGITSSIMGSTSHSNK